MGEGLSFNLRMYEYYFPSFMGGALRLFWRSKNPFVSAEIERKVIFIHVPKNAGRSICKDLFGAEGRHIQLKRYYLYSPSQTLGFFKFAVVRDPVDRFVSAFNGLKGSARGDGEYDVFVRRNIEPFSSVSEFIDWMRASKSNADRVLSWVHFYPQYKWISVRGTDVTVDRLLRFESLSTDWPKFASEMGFSPNLSFVGKGKADKVKLSEDQVRFLREVYSRDCELFFY